MTKIFFDTEFTGLHQETSLISIGLVAENGRSFYAEFNDYNKDQVDEWLQENVIDKLLYNGYNQFNNFKSNRDDYTVTMKGNSKEIKEALETWLEQFDYIDMWSDCLSYDWILFNNLFGSAFDIPDNINYIPFDICTLFKILDIDPDINREEYIGLPFSENKHNALHDAKVIKECYYKLNSAYHRKVINKRALVSKKH
ncbi:hypothetical protein INTERNEXUS_15 [Bacillus phage vB_BspM_Internexus]|nr:hypothetical protein INTERNEXUS_15 [Bacillus phage vB_BspM_Internexus]